MNDDTTPEETPAAETPTGPRPTAKRPSALTHDSDRAIRPGFRNPPTPKSLSQQRKKTKKK